MMNSTALTPAQAADPVVSDFANRLLLYYTGRGRQARVGRIEPNNIVLSLQPLTGVQRYPQWKTIDSDLVLLGTSASNILMMDEARGFLLPRQAEDLKPGHYQLCCIYSPFVGNRSVLNIFAIDPGGLSSAVDAITRPRILN